MYNSRFDCFLQHTAQDFIKIFNTSNTSLLVISTILFENQILRREGEIFVGVINFIISTSIDNPFLIRMLLGLILSSIFTVDILKEKKKRVGCPSRNIPLFQILCLRFKHQFTFRFTDDTFIQIKDYIST